MAWLWVWLAALVFAVVVWLAFSEDVEPLPGDASKTKATKPDYALILKLERELGFAPPSRDQIFEDAHERAMQLQRRRVSGNHGTLGEQWAEWFEREGPDPDDINDWYQ